MHAQQKHACQKNKRHNLCVPHRCGDQQQPFFLRSLTFGVVSSFTSGSFASSSASRPSIAAVTASKVGYSTPFQIPKKTQKSAREHCTIQYSTIYNVQYCTVHNIQSAIISCFFCRNFQTFLGECWSTNTFYCLTLSVSDLPPNLTFP